MPRRSYDLLDVFRAPAPVGAERARRATEGRRRARIALAGTIAGLLVLLAFTAGVGLSRRSRVPEAQAPALASVRRGEWILRAETPRVSPAGAKDLATLLPRELGARWPELAGRVRIAPGDSKASMKVIVAGFRTRDEADRALRALALWSLEASFPFRRGIVVPVE